MDHKKFVLTESYQEFLEYCDKKALDESRLQYVDNPIQLSSVQNENITVTGNYTDN